MRGRGRPAFSGGRGPRGGGVVGNRSAQLPRAEWLRPFADRRNRPGTAGIGSRDSVLPALGRRGRLAHRTRIYAAGRNVDIRYFPTPRAPSPCEGARRFCCRAVRRHRQAAQAFDRRSGRSQTGATFGCGRRRSMEYPGGRWARSAGSAKFAIVSNGSQP